ncbi:unnamed protein product [Rodentolepis nana]|uniref:Inhibitor of growth protein 3 n=1 Tax=Rodentolepis nana TaxID=102285 RepID=A0A158QHR0_RODNA|nr:unnamed protein product [Rodentolepis nana]
MFAIGFGFFGYVSLMSVVKRGEVHEFAVKELTNDYPNDGTSRVQMESEFGIRMSGCQFAVITYGVVAMGDCVRILMEIMDGSVEEFKYIYEKVHKKITSELNKFRLELEADNVGIATKIEHRVRTYLNIKDPAQKHAARFYGVNRNTYRRNPFASDQDKRYFVHKKRMYPLSGLTSSGRAAIRHPKTSSFASEESSLSIISDGPNRLIPSSDNLQQISGADSINSIDPNLQDSEFGPFTSEIGDEFLAEDEEDDPIQFDALPRRSRFIGTPQIPSADNSRLHRGGHSPFVSNSDTENLGGGVNTGGQIIAEFQPSSIDEMLVNTSTPSPIVKTGESPRWISSGTPDNANTNKSRRAAAQHSRRPSQISVPDMTADDINSYHYANISQSPSRLLQQQQQQQQQQDNQDLGGGASSDPDNRKYCFCRDVSYGEMIACDAPNCPVEWFHYPCVNLSVAPKGKWICPLCSCSRFPSSSSSSSARKRIRR